jgi:hypothetical protein
MLDALHAIRSRVPKIGLKCVGVCEIFGVPPMNGSDKPKINEIHQKSSQRSGRARDIDTMTLPDKPCKKEEAHPSLMFKRLQRAFTSGASNYISRMIAHDAI